MTVVKVLFVCMGNICRSPTAEGVFRKVVIDAELRDDILVEKLPQAEVSRFSEGDDLRFAAAFASDYPALATCLADSKV